MPHLLACPGDPMLFLILFGLPALLLGGLAFAIVSMVAELSKFPSRRADRRRAEGRCAHCGYDLRATPGRCPECGRSAITPPATLT